MKQIQFSIDGGRNWVDMDENVRFVFRDADEDDDEMRNLHVNITNEGIILDVIGQESGYCITTAALDVETLLDFTT